MMVSFRLLLLLLMSVQLLAHGVARSAERSPLRIAVVTPAGEGGEKVEAELRRLIGSEERLAIELIDRDLTRLAQLGSGYAGGLNLSLEEARGLGQAFGADYFILGQVLVIPRPGEVRERSFEGVAALFLVESRTGRLRRFRQEMAPGADLIEVEHQLRSALTRIWDLFVVTLGDDLPSVRPTPDGGAPTADVIFTDDDIPGMVGLQPPVFLRQLKPAYPATAARIEVEGTVELTAVFRADGRIDEIEVRRWAGFELDESSIATVRQLRFQSATYNGQPVSFRGLVRYNFRRPAPQAIRTPTRNREEVDRLKRSINDRLKIRPIP